MFRLFLALISLFILGCSASSSNKASSNLILGMRLGACFLFMGRCSISALTVNTNEELVKTVRVNQKSFELIVFPVYVSRFLQTGHSKTSADSLP